MKARVRALLATRVGQLLTVFLAGLVAGAVYWLISVRSPAPPIIGLLGLFGILIGEALGSRVIARIRRRRLRDEG